MKTRNLLVAAVALGAAWTHGIVPVGVPGARPIAGERRGVCTRYRLPVLAPWSVSVFEPAERQR